jgi:tetratricopeptide (TPR) repeat protein
MPGRNSTMAEHFIPPHGGYQDLLSFKKAQIVYDATVKFCADLLSRRDRTVDQMVQAARSGKQNIVDASTSSAPQSAMKLQRRMLWPSLGLVLLALLGIRTVSHTGIWLHLALGRDIAAHGIQRADPLAFTTGGISWVNASWLYDLLVYRLWQLGNLHLVTLVHVAAVLAAFLFLLPLAIRRAGHIGTGLALVLCAWIIAPVLRATPMAFCLVFAGGLLAILSRPRRLTVVLATALPLLWVWSQMHHSFVLGLLLCGLAVIEAGSAGDRKRMFGLAGLTGAGLLVTMAGPYGPTLHLYALETAGGLGASYVAEWISPFSWKFADTWTNHVVTAALVVGAIGIITEKARLPLVITATAILGAVLAVLHAQAHVEVFALLAFPFLALSFHSALENVRARVEGARTESFSVVNTLGGAALAVWVAYSLVWVLSSQFYAATGSASSVGLGVEYDMYPEAASLLLDRKDFPETTLHLAQDGGYLAWRYPHRKIFTDQRAELYGAEFYRRLSSALLDGPAALTLLENTWDPGAIIINCSLPQTSRSIRNLLASGHWGLAYFDGTTAILMRTVEAYSGFLQNTEYQEAGLRILESAVRTFAASTGAVLKPPVSPRLVGASGVFLALEKYPEACSVYQRLARGTRGMSSAWLGLGFCQLKMAETAEAIRTLEHTTRLFRKDIRAWLWLSAAYAELGRTDEALRAYEQAAAIDFELARQFGSPLDRARPGAPTNAPPLAPMDGE